MTGSPSTATHILLEYSHHGSGMWISGCAHFYPLPRTSSVVSQAMPADDMIGETTDRIHISARREELKGSDADVAARDTSKNRAGQRCFVPNRLARSHGGKN